MPASNRALESAMKASADDLEGFVENQDPVFDAARAELQVGKKRSHWVWFVFPQMRGLGRSSTALFYGLESAAEARRYWAYPVLGPRLKGCVGQVLSAPRGRSAQDIFGSPDDLKFWSSMTLFNRVVPEEPLFAAALACFHGGQEDMGTVDLLAGANPPPKVDEHLVGMPAFAACCANGAARPAVAAPRAP